MRMLVSACSVVISSLSAAAEVHHIEGAKSNFCLPDSNKVQSVPWVPADKAGTSDSFAFAGCAAIKGNDDSCGTPPSVEGGYVEEKSAYRSQKWGDFRDGSMIKRITLDPSAELKLAQDGAVIIVHNQKLWERDWYIWERTASILGNRVLRLNNEDVLLASCHYLPVLPLQAQSKDIYSCDRSIQSEDYSLHYSYRSETLVPKDLKSLDAAMIATIDHWRCSKVP